MPKLSFISDENLNKTVQNLLHIAQQAQQKKNLDFEKNVIDPFALLFEMSGFGIDGAAWEKNEKIRQTQKTLQNHVGNFHQQILGLVDDWADTGIGKVVDLVSMERRVIAEIKNKYNTVKGSDKVKVYDNLEKLVMTKGHNYKSFTGYYVEVIPKSGQRYDKEFTPSDSTKGQQRQPNPLIRQIDGYSFYGLVTGVPDALNQLFAALPQVVEENSAYKFTDLSFAQAFFDKAFR